MNLNIPIKLSKSQLVYSPTKSCLMSEIYVINLVCANTFVRLVYFIMISLSGDRANKSILKSRVNIKCQK